MPVKYIRIWKGCGYNWRIITTDFSLELLTQLTNDFFLVYTFERMTNTLDIHLTGQKTKREQNGRRKQIA